MPRPTVPTAAVVKLLKMPYREQTAELSHLRDQALAGGDCHLANTVLDPMIAFGPRQRAEALLRIADPALG